MANPPRKKGTGFETEVKRALGFPNLRRTSPGCKWDIEEPGESPIEVLATRPDRGQTLISLPLGDFAALYEAYCKVRDVRPGLRIECKRYAKGMPVGMLHTIYSEKFSSSQLPTSRTSSLKESALGNLQPLQLASSPEPSEERQAT